MLLVEKTVIRFLVEASTNQDEKYNNNHSSFVALKGCDIWLVTYKWIDQEKLLVGALKGNICRGKRVRLLWILKICNC